MQANSNVKVQIGAQLNGEFDKVFNDADKRMNALEKSAADMSKKMGDVQAYRRQQNALKESGRAYTEARQKVAQLRAEIEKTEAPTNRQQAALKRAETQARRTGAAYTEARTKLSDMSRALARAGVDTSRLSNEYRRLQTEIGRTKTAVDQMAAAQARQERSLKRQQAIMSAMGKSWSAMKNIGVGAAAAGMALSRPIGKGLSYDEKLTYMADTAGQGQSVAGRTSLKKELSDAIITALREGGGTREDAASALMTLIASGKFEGKEAGATLPTVTKTAFAAGASSEDIAKTAVALKQFGIGDIPGAFDAMQRAGQLGNFELKDMARWLPQQMAAGKSAGYSGMGGLKDLLAFNQTAMRTAGSQDEAGNNVVNLLAKFSSKEFATSMGKAVTVRPGDPTTAKGKKKGEFDWAGYSIRARGEGKTAVEAFGEVIDRQLKDDKKYQALQKKLAAAKSDQERTETLGAMSMIAEGSAIGELIADRQALMAALAARYGTADMKELRAKLNDSGGAVNDSSEFVRSQTWAKGIDAKNALDQANESSFNQASGPLAWLYDAATKLSQEFPGLTTAAYSATTALTALAAAGFGIGAASLLSGKGKAAQAAGNAAGAAASGSSIASKAGGAMSFMGRAAAGLPLVGLAATAMTTTDAEMDELQNGKGRFEALRAKHGQGTIDAARKKYQPWYQFGKGYGKENEEWVGKYVKDQGGKGNIDATANAATAAASAATAAASANEASAKAAAAAQSRPNVTQHYNFNITGTDPKGIGSEVERIMRTRDRSRAADDRASMVGAPEY